MKLIPPNVENLRRASQAIYIAVPEDVAKDISQLFTWAADRIEELERQVPKPTVHTLEAAPLISSPPEGGPT